MSKTAEIYYPSGETERHFVKSIWRLHEYNIHKITETILPKGTVEIIFNLSDDITYFNPNLPNGQKLPNCFINGINFKPFKLIKNGQQVFLGIQLNAIGLKVLFDMPAMEFNDNIYEGWLVCKSLDSLSQQLFYKKSFNEQVEAILRWINERISVSRANKTLPQVCKLFYSKSLHDLTVKNLCKETFFSDRHLRRLSNEWLGMNTETFIQYNKYLASLHLLHRSDLSLTQVGLQAGYYDQSHFIREFKSFTDLTPKAYQTSINYLPGHIFD
ncbi:MAG: helix-turn-helix domain-containing protein [Saprospiraceae bacterium]